MCGIVGFNWEDRNLVKQMADLMHHRGPDDSGCYTDKNISLAHRRLSILDLSKKGRQPMLNEDGTLCISYNGEVYNYVEIRKELENKGYRFISDTDTEVILKAYQEYGKDCLAKFNGMFAFAIWDSSKNELFLARDRIGIKPLFYYYSSGRFIFSSSLRPIFLADKVKKKIDFHILNNYLAFGYSNSNDTIFEGIKRLPPGYYVLFKNGKILINKYWDVRVDIVNKPGEYFLNKARELLNDSVRKRLISDVPLGIYLSGGLDSSSIAGIASKFSDKINTFSVGFGEDFENELKYAKMVALELNTIHHELHVESDKIYDLKEIMRFADEPIADLAMVPVYLMSKNTKKDATVVLTGEGNDEIWGGYSHFYRHNKYRNSGRLFPKPLFRLALNTLSKIIADPNLKYRFSYVSKLRSEDSEYITFNRVFNDFERRQLLRNKSDFVEVSKENISPRDCFKSGSFMNKMLLADVSSLLVNSYLVKTDRMTMANSVEARVPLLDHRIVELSFQITDKIKFDGNDEKHFFKKIVKDVVPKEILHREKRGFMVPTHVWQKKLGSAYFGKIMENSLMIKKGVLNPDYIDKLVRLTSSQSMVGANKLWTLVLLELWLQNYENDFPDISI